MHKGKLQNFNLIGALPIFLSSKNKYTTALQTKWKSFQWYKVHIWCSGVSGMKLGDNTAVTDNINNGSIPVGCPRDIFQGRHFVKVAKGGTDQINGSWSPISSATVWGSSYYSCLFTTDFWSRTLKRHTRFTRSKAKKKKRRYLIFDFSFLLHHYLSLVLWLGSFLLNFLVFSKFLMQTGFRVSNNSKCRQFT